MSFTSVKRKVRRCANLKMQMAVDVTTEMFGQCSANQKGSSGYLSEMVQALHCGSNARRGLENAADIS